LISLKNEIARKTIHLSSIIIPLFLLFYGKELTLLYLLPITIVFLILDVLRIRTKSFKSLYNYFFISVTRSNESNKLTGASYVFLSSLIIIFFFSVNIAVISLFIMIISDTLAAIFGRIYGTIKIRNKTLEGSFAFFISSSIIILFSKDINLYLAFISILLATLTELYSPFDDNLSVPIAFGLTYIILTTISKGLGLL
tara:strand:+ start:155 stop:748 length:594 start_codon:yes stop_codon:yes gene_type:complete